MEGDSSSTTIVKDEEKQSTCDEPIILRHTQSITKAKKRNIIRGTGKTTNSVVFCEVGLSKNPLEKKTTNSTTFSAASTTHLTTTTTTAGTATSNQEQKRELSHTNSISSTVYPGIPFNSSHFSSDSNIYICICAKRYTLKEEYMSHMLSHRPKDFKCLKCSGAFSSSLSLVCHQQVVHSGNEQNIAFIDIVEKEEGGSSLTKNIHCRYCKESIEADVCEHLQNHLYGKLECPVCGIAFLKSESMEHHVEKCHTSLLSSLLKFEHMQRERDNINKDTSHHLHLCDVCGKALTTAVRLAQHRYSEHQEHYPWCCRDCNLSFSSSVNLKKHFCHKKDSFRKTSRAVKSISQTSTKVLEDFTPDWNSSGEYTCPVCSLVLGSRKSFKDHLRSHKGITFKCSFCDVTVKSMASLRAHLSTKHTQNEIYQCKSCSLIFFSAGRLQYHIKRQHTAKYAYRNLCHLCGKSYPYPSELRLHLRSHRNERPYKCDQCPKTFMKKGDLTYHIRSHTGERPHKCPHCNARFPRPNTLLTHVRQQHQVSDPLITKDKSTSTRTTSSSKTITGTTKTTMAVASSFTAIGATATVMVLSPGVKHNSTSGEQQSQSADAATAVESTSNEGIRSRGERTMIPVVDRRLVDAVVEDPVANMQPVQYVQVDGLEAGQTVQTVQAVPQMMEGVEYDDGPYQIVHLQILP